MRKSLRIILILIFLGIFIFSGYKVVNYFIEANISKNANNKLIEKAITPIDITKPDEDKQEDETIAPFTVDFEELKAENKDIVGWIYSKNTPINYPVLQSDDNDYYLRKLITGEYNTAGSLFMDYRNKSNLEDNKIIIYGHNMKNATMFGTLQKYRNQDYFNEHKIMYYFTPDSNYLVRIFSAYTETTQSSIYTETNLNQDLIDQVQRKSNFQCDIQVTENDKIIILSTCSYDYDEARYVVFGKLEQIP